MAKPPLVFSSLINVDLWNQANWLGVAYLMPSGDPLRPGLGLLFGNEATAVKLFSELQDRLGIRDVHEELRVAVVEGKLDGEDGYTVHLGSNVDRIVARAKAEGLGDADKLAIATVGRLHRMGNSGPLGTFKTQVATHKQFDLLPVTISPNRTAGPIDPERDLKHHPNLAITKKEIVFRSVVDISGKDDLDYIVLGKPVSSAN